MPAHPKRRPVLPPKLQQRVNRPSAPKLPPPPRKRPPRHSGHR